MDVLEERVLEERYPYLNEEEYIIMADSREEHQRYFSEYGGDMSKIHALVWYFNTKQKQYLIDREFSVVVQHPKGGNIVCTCVKGNIIEEKEYCLAIGLCGFDYKSFE